MRMILPMLPLLSTIAASALAAGRSDVSWGKAGVSRAIYDADALACSLPAASRDVRADGETREYVRGFEVLERENNMPPMARPSDEEGLVNQANRNVLLRRAYSPDRKVDALQVKLLGEVETCLAARGYSRFALSKAQSRQLKRLKAGSPERRDFLYRLGSDAAILLSQNAP